MFWIIGRYWVCLTVKKQTFSHSDWSFLKSSHVANLRKKSLGIVSHLSFNEQTISHSFKSPFQYFVLFSTPMDAFGLNEQKIRSSGLIPPDCPSYFLELGTYST